MDKSQVKVSVILLAYNQEPYIEKAIDSILAQKTNFPFELLIHDDCSTDGTRQIIARKHAENPSVIKVIYQPENQYSRVGCTILTDYLFPLVRGQYVALCEGDDSWPNPNKLQMQSDFLDQNLEFAGVGGISRYLTDDNQFLKMERPLKKYQGKEITSKQFLRKANFGSNTLMYRAELNNHSEYQNALRSSLIGDIIFILNVFYHGRLFILPQVFEHHLFQTRKNASNYNSIYSAIQRFQNSTKTLKQIEKSYGSAFNLRGWYLRQVVYVYINSIKAGKKSDFLHVYEDCPTRYKANPILVLILYGPSILYNKAAHVVKTYMRRKSSNLVMM